MCQRWFAIAMTRCSRWQSRTSSASSRARPVQQCPSNPSACLHYGSRVSAGTPNRLDVQLQFPRPSAFEWCFDGALAHGRRDGPARGLRSADRCRSDSVTRGDHPSKLAADFRCIAIAKDSPFATHVIHPGVEGLAVQCSTFGCSGRNISPIPTSSKANSTDCACWVRPRAQGGFLVGRLRRRSLLHRNCLVPSCARWDESKS